METFYCLLAIIFILKVKTDTQFQFTHTILKLNDR